MKLTANVTFNSTVQDKFDVRKPRPAIKWGTKAGKQAKALLTEAANDEALLETIDDEALPQSLVPSPFINPYLQSSQDGLQPFGSLQSVGPYSFNAEGQYPSCLQELEGQPNTPRTPTTPTTPVLVVAGTPRATLVRSFSGQQPLTQTNCNQLFSPRSAGVANGLRADGATLYRASGVSDAVVSTLKTPRGQSVFTRNLNRR